MGLFQKHLVVKCLLKENSKFRFEVYGHDFIYETNEKEIIVVPVGFKTDLVSAPWFFTRIIPSTGKYNEAAVVHDYLCFLANQRLCDRKKADKIFLEAMIDLEVGKIKRSVMYFGVRFYTKFFFFLVIYVA